MMRRFKGGQDFATGVLWNGPTSIVCDLAPQREKSCMLCMYILCSPGVVIVIQCLCSGMYLSYISFTSSRSPTAEYRHQQATFDNSSATHQRPITSFEHAEACSMMSTQC